MLKFIRLGTPNEVNALWAIARRFFVYAVLWRNKYYSAFFCAIFVLSGKIILYFQVKVKKNKQYLFVVSGLWNKIYIMIIILIGNNFYKLKSFVWFLETFYIFSDCQDEFRLPLQISYNVMLEIKVGGIFQRKQSLTSSVILVWFSFADGLSFNWQDVGFWLR